MKRSKDKAWFNISEAASYLRVSRDRLLAWRQRGGGPKFENSRVIRYRGTDLDYFMWAGGCK